MSKYSPLQDFLTAQRAGEVPMTFAEIERLIGGPLPPSKLQRTWWSNNASNNVMTRAWRAAGFRTARVDVAGERLVFRREHEEGTSTPGGGAAEAGNVLERLRARLGGTVRIAPGVDITAPTGERWDAQG